MDDRGVLRRPPYHAVLGLVHIAESNWAEFDGWCSSRALDPATLSLARFLNLVYYWVVSRLHADYDAKGKVTKSAEQKRKEFDRMLAPRTSIADGGVPSWWTDDDDATASAFMAARQAGFKIPVVDATATEV